MRERLCTIGFVAVLAAILLLGTLGSLAFAPELQSDDPRIIVVNSNAVATDTNFSNHTWGRYSNADLFYRIDQGSITNTISLEIEVSPDGTDWYNHSISPTLVSNNSADANGYVGEIPIHGWQWRIVANVTNTNTVTPVLKMVLR